MGFRVSGLGLLGLGFRVIGFRVYVWHLGFMRFRVLLLWSPGFLWVCKSSGSGIVYSILHLQGLYCLRVQGSANKYRTCFRFCIGNGSLVVELLDWCLRQTGHRGLRPSGNLHAVIQGSLTTARAVFCSVSPFAYSTATTRRTRLHAFREREDQWHLQTLLKS